MEESVRAVSGGLEPVAKSHKGHPIYGFDGPNENRPIFGYHPEKGHPICASKLRNKDAVCLSSTRLGNGRCRRHGGTSLRGNASPQYKTGEHSIYTPPPPSLLQDYDSMADHSELFQHRTSVKLTNALINAVLAEYDEGGGRDAWRTVSKALRKFKVARMSGDRVKLSEAVAELELAIQGGAGRQGRQSRRKEIKGLMELHRRLVDSQTKLDLIEGETYSVEQMTAIVQAFGEVIRRYLPEEARRQFFQEFTALVGSRLYHRNLDPDEVEVAETVETVEASGNEPGESGSEPRALEGGDSGEEG